MKVMEISNLFLIGFTFIRASFAHSITRTSPYSETSIIPEEQSMPTILQFDYWPRAPSSEAIEHLSELPVHSLAIDQRARIENTAPQSSAVIFGRKHKPHILKSSKGHISPTVEPEVSTSLNHVSTSNELNNNDVFISSSVQPSPQSINDLKAEDFTSDSRALTSAEPAVPQEILKPIPNISPKHHDVSESSKIPTSEPDTVITKKLFGRLPHIITRLKHILHSSDEKGIPSAPNETVEPHHSVIESIFHKKYHRSGEPAPDHTKQVPNESPHDLAQSILDKIKHTTIPKVSSLIHKVHHKSKFISKISSLIH